MAETIDKQGIRTGELTIHSDRGSAMIAQPVAHLLADLGVTKSHSRPHTSNDNPYSESHFRTLKYRPDFPKSFGSFEDAHAHCGRFFMVDYIAHHNEDPVPFIWTKTAKQIITKVRRGRVASSRCSIARI